MILRRTAKFKGAEIEVEVELPGQPTPRVIVLATHQLNRAVEVYENACPYCGTLAGTIHTPDCAIAYDNQIALARKEAIEEGMSP